MEAADHDDRSGRADPSIGDTGPSGAAQPAERIRVAGLDAQSAEALLLAISRLAKRYGVEVRTELTEESPPSQQ